MSYYPFLDRQSVEIEVDVEADADVEHSEAEQLQEEQDQDNQMPRGVTSPNQHNHSEPNNYPPIYHQQQGDLPYGFQSAQPDARQSYHMQPNVGRPLPHGIHPYQPMHLPFDPYERVPGQREYQMGLNAAMRLPLNHLQNRYMEGDYYGGQSPYGNGYQGVPPVYPNGLPVYPNGQHAELNQPQSYMSMSRNGSGGSFNGTTARHPTQDGFWTSRTNSEVKGRTFDWRMYVSPQIDMEYRRITNQSGPDPNAYGTPRHERSPTDEGMQAYEKYAHRMSLPEMEPNPPYTDRTTSLTTKDRDASLIHEKLLFQKRQLVKEEILKDQMLRDQIVREEMAKEELLMREAVAREERRQGRHESVRSKSRNNSYFKQSLGITFHSNEMADNAVYSGGEGNSKRPSFQTFGQHNDRRVSSKSSRVQESRHSHNDQSVVHTVSQRASRGPMEQLVVRSSTSEVSVQTDYAEEYYLELVKEERDYLRNKYMHHLQSYHSEELHLLMRASHDFRKT